LKDKEVCGDNIKERREGNNLKFPGKNRIPSSITMEVGLEGARKAVQGGQ